jgi:hypothetical protein
MKQFLRNYLTSADKRTRGEVATETHLNVGTEVVRVLANGGGDTRNTIRRGEVRDNYLHTTEGTTRGDNLSTHILEEGGGEIISKSRSGGVTSRYSPRGDSTSRVDRVEERGDVCTTSEGGDSAEITVVEGHLLSVRTDGSHLSISLPHKKNSMPVF